MPIFSFDLRLNQMWLHLVAMCILRLDITYIMNLKDNSQFS
jgi:hypothetical protein